jgi:hypothetical protein
MLCFLLIIFFSNPSSAFMHMMGNRHMEFDGHNGEFHPFLVHMGMPDEPGEVNLRITGFGQRLDSDADSGIGAHLEAGLWERVGLHIRNDDIKEDGTEVMLQFAIFSNDENEGISLTAENQFPGSTGEAVTKFKAGLTATKLLWGHPLHISFHYEPTDMESEIAASLILKANERLALVVEYSAHSNRENASYLLEGIKFKASRFMGIGIAFQAPLSEGKDFDNRTLAQVSMSF